MDIIEALNKLSFSFWQPIVLIAIFLFRQELRGLAARVTSMKGPAGTEIILTQRNDAIGELVSMKAAIEKSNVTDKEIVGLIETKIQNRLLAALSNIKSNTTYLWPELRKAKVGETIDARIRIQTFEKIRGDVSLLQAAGVLEFSLLGNDRYSVREMVIRNISEKLVALVAEVDLAY